VQAMLEARAAVDVNVSAEGTALIKACEHGREEMVNCLLRNRASIDLQNQNGWSALLMSSGKNSANTPPGPVGPFLGIGRALLDAGADVNLTSTDGLSSLLRAAMSGVRHVDEYIKMLLAAGARVEDPASPLSALMCACDVGDLRAVRTLIDAKANLDRPATPLANSYTSLMFAAQNGHTDVVRALVRARADVHYMAPVGDGADGEEPLALMPEKPRPSEGEGEEEDRVYRALRLKVGPSALALAAQGVHDHGTLVKSGHSACARVLLNAGAKVTEAVDEEGLKLLPWYRIRHTG